MSKINSQLPNKFIVDIILAGSRLISDLALMHGIEPTPQNIYEAGKMLSSVGLTMSAASRHLSPEEMKNDTSEMLDCVQDDINNIKDKIDDLHTAINKSALPDKTSN